MSIHNVIGIGDAENDHVFLRAVGLGVAVANASEAILQAVEMVTKESYGQGVVEIIDQLLKDEYALITRVRHKITVGSNDQGIALKLILSTAY